MKSANIISVITFAIFLACLGYFFTTPFGAGIIDEVRNYILPCSQPMYYRIGSVDSRFGITPAYFETVIQKAKAIWETPIKKNLFEYKKDAALSINLVYDYRQEATDRLKKMGVTIDTSEAAYNDIKQRYESATAEYSSMKAELDGLVRDYQKQKDLYESDVAYWNARGGAPRSEFDRLQAEKNQLTADLAVIQEKQNEVNNLVPTINALVEVMNKIAAELNIAAGAYNKIGETRGGEFEEGVYMSDISGKKIDIYEFDSVARLERVLAHEFGHALGFPHITDPKAIMYKLNQGTNEYLTAQDLALLKNTCRIK